LIRGGIPLTSVRGLNAPQIRTLNVLWINTAQELAGVYGTSEPVRGRLAATLGIQRSALDPIVTAAQRLIPLMFGAPSRALALDGAPYMRGIRRCAAVAMGSSAERWIPRVAASRLRTGSLAP